jgi:uncharacterized protein YndB with AHSA1/START domain
MSRAVRWKLHLSSPPEAVWELIATDAGRERFWCETSRQEGEAIVMTFSNGWVEHAEILEATRPARLAVRYFGTPVTFTLTPDGSGGTDLELGHEGIRDEDWDEVLPGWLNVLFPLKAMADHGVDLRNHDPSRSWDEGYADA